MNQLKYEDLFSNLAHAQRKELQNKKSKFQLGRNSVNPTAKT